jgi:hypothetical protein
VDANFQLVYSISNIIMFLAVIPALWVSGRIILRNPILEERSISLFLWLVLGGFFLIPMIDVLAELRSLISFIVSPEENMTPIPLFLGTTSWLLYSIISLTLTIFVYAVAIYYGRLLFAKHGLPVIEQLSLNDMEQGFVVLGFAGLFNAMIHGIVMNFLWIGNTGATRTVTLGSWGAMLGWILAFLLLALAIIYMNGKLENERL